MTRYRLRPPPVLSGTLLATLLTVVLTSLVGGLLVAGTTGTASASSSSESSGRPDPRLGRKACALMGRVNLASGCSRTTCRRPGEQIRVSPNAETCTIGGREGTAYGTEVDFRICAQLHREWVAPVNLCASNPRRDETVLTDAPQCRRPYTTYVTTSRTDAHRATRSEDEDRYDVCLRPQEAVALEREADRTGQNLRSLAVRAARTESPGADTPTVLMVGDSLTWRGTDELATRRPDWVIDGASGRNFAALDDRLIRFQRSHGSPTGLVIALGTNPARHYKIDMLREVLTRVPVETPVMVVTPYRGEGLNRAEQVRAVSRSSRMVSLLAATRPHTCVADWRGLVSKHPDMLVDGTHQTHRVEGTWAKLVSADWTTCLAQQ